VVESTEADFVLVDTPPLLTAPEAALAATISKSLLLVVDARRANPEQLEEVLHEIDRAGAEILGVVMNRTKLRRFPRKSPYYYAYTPPAVVPFRRRAAADGVTRSTTNDR
jgi:Mrp family chromosome partitioning ATPase